MSVTLATLAELTGATLEGDPNHVITGVEDLQSARPDQAAFLENPRYEKHLKTSRAGVVFVQPHTEREEGKNYLVCDLPSFAFQTVIERLIPAAVSDFDAIHPSAVISKTAQIGEGVVIGPHVSIDRGAKIGAGTILGAGVVIGPEAIIGEQCHLHANAVVRERCRLGKRVVLQPGAIIGSCGYGYVSDAEGVHRPLKQLGIVVLEDDVEIGANTTVDRARFKETRIGKGTKIDNLVQIGHQVEIGPHNLIVAQTGIAGSTKTGHHVVMAGQVGVTGHLTITDNVILTARTAAIKNIDNSGVYAGVPATPMREYTQQLVHARQLGKLVARVKKLEQTTEASGCSHETRQAN